MNRTEGVLGLARKAGALEIGTNNVLASIRANKAILVLTATDISAGTAKQLTDKASYRKIPVETVPLDMESLGHCVGKQNTAAVALTDEGFLISYRKTLEHQEGERLWQKM